MPLPFGRFGKSARDQRAANWSGLESLQGDRDVYLIKWGRTPSFPLSFHYALLVADQYGERKPGPRTTGSTFSWGSFEAGKLIKRGAEANIKPFDYQVELQMENTYEWLGQTTLGDTEIQAIMSDCGKKYNIVFNNCQMVTCQVAQMLTSSWREVERAQEFAHKDKEGVQHESIYARTKWKRESREKQRNATSSLPQDNLQAYPNGLGGFYHHWATTNGTMGFL